MNQRLFNKIIVITILVLALAAPMAGAKTGSRQKVIDFDEELIEGLSKQPLDSVSQISERGKKRRKAHLYRKRGSFRTETAETLRELRYLQ